MGAGYALPGDDDEDGEAPDGMDPDAEEDEEEGDDEDQLQ